MPTPPAHSPARPAAAPRRTRGPARIALLLLLVLPVGCGGELSTPGETLRLLGAALPPAFLEERYDAPIQTSGGLRPFRYEIVAGALPPGLELSAGVVAGVPSEVGSFEFTIEVSDANLSKTVREYTLTVAEIPPPELILTLPPTEIRGPATVAVAARGSELRGVRTLLRWDPTVLQLVDDSVRIERRELAVFFEAGAGSLQIDAALLGDTADDEVALVRFELEPTPEALASADDSSDPDADPNADPRGVRVGLSAASEFSARGGHAFLRSSAGAAPPSLPDDPAVPNPDDPGGDPSGSPS